MVEPAGRGLRVQARAVTKTYRGGVVGLAGVDLDIPGGIHGLLGPNGAGKTSLMRILAGIIRPTNGAVRVGEYDLASERGRTAMKRVLGYLPQELGLYPDLSGREFLEYIALLKAVAPTVARRRISELLDTVGLTRDASRKLKTYSGGMKRRIGIAQALLNDPALLIVDEPTVGLDPEERIRFRTLLAELAGARTVLLSTHIVEDIAQTSRALTVIDAGRVRYTGTTRELMVAARGHVFTVTNDGPRPAGALTVVSMVQHTGSTEYRVVGMPDDPTHVTPVEPGLEDAYVWLMQGSASADAA
jgi:ABC-type multidrug transport system ATPase subunit